MQRRTSRRPEAPNDGRLDDLEDLKAELDLSPSSLRETLDTALAIEAGRPRLQQDGAGRERLVQPVASRLGPRFLDWQLAQTPEESWAECERHAKAILEGIPAPKARPASEPKAAGGSWQPELFDEHR